MLTVRQDTERRLRALVRESAGEVLSRPGDVHLRARLRARATRLLSYTMYMSEDELDRERRVEILERMTRYVRHLDDCPIAGDLEADRVEGRCTCGLDDLREELVGAAGGSRSNGS